MPRYPRSEKIIEQVNKIISQCKRQKISLDEVTDLFLAVSKEISNDKRIKDPKLSEKLATMKLQILADCRKENFSTPELKNLLIKFGKAIQTSRFISQLTETFEEAERR